jgi:WD40 repeat protein
MTLRTILALGALGGWLGLAVSQAAPKPVSYTREIVPLFKRSCNGCHHPGKLKGELDLTTYAALTKGGKHGASFKPGQPAASRIIEEISGSEPAMPKEGEPLSKSEVALVARWIREGAKNDTSSLATRQQTAPEFYPAAPTISALAYSPDGTLLAVSGHHEIVLHHADGSGIVARLGGDARRIESLAFSPNGKLLAASGGSPAEFGEIQIWDLETKKRFKAYKITSDSLFGVSWSGNSENVAFGCADKTVRVIAIQDGKELLKFDHHSDWVLGTAFTLDSQRVVSCSRDKAMKLISVAQGQFVDDLNKVMESWLCLTRHPTTNLVACGSDQGTPRIYRMAENPARAANNNDVNLVRQFERQPGPVHALAFSPDGQALAVGGMGGEARVYNVNDGNRLATLKGHTGAIFALAYHPTKKQICTGGFDGQLRIFDVPGGNLVVTFAPVPLKTTAPLVSADKRIATPIK